MAPDDLDHQWLVDKYEELHSLPPDSNGRHFVRGRIAEYCSQNAVSRETELSARAQALAHLAQNR